MTERYNGFLVVLESEIREDDAESTLDAIRHIKGVLRVTGVPDNDNATFCVAVQERLKIRKKLFEFVKDLGLQ